ncbi:hypothetical protein SAMN05444161_0133 [Rhizobiales bacterium GAS191]|nr:hypothetical protein SAMN05444161_0133 [Rhizobiales bacterium GAS191]SED26535.1 hypothetical protein SAMN05519104_3175 [Rhizobiales bacterium GAS188]
MKLSATLRRSLAIIVMVGLLFAPFTSPAAMASMPADQGMSIGSDMPCCPDPQLPECNKSCPLMTLCAAKCFPNGPSLTTSLVLRPWVSAQLAVANDAERDGLPTRPPPRPPKA